MNKNKVQFMSYPEITDDDFYEKIYIKKEFREHEIKEKIDWNKIQTPTKDFLLEPHQLFLKNYISPDTPYNGILIFHGTGVGKTCSALSIAEGFKKTLKNMNKRILIISNLKKNFENELYNFHKERIKKNPDDIVQCTGRAYELGEDSLYLSQRQREKEIDKIKKIYYEFTGYQKFANYIIDSTDGWKGSDKNINEKIKRFISTKFDNRVIIIDEIQNMKTDKKEETKNIQPILEAIIKYGKNIKLILMSATPMFDRPDEIIFYINLLLQNDGRKKIERSEIFDSKNGTLKPGADKKLRDIFKGYVSYIRSEKPFRFPFRIYPKETRVPNVNYYISGHKIDEDKKLKYTKLLTCPMQNVQLNTYMYYLEKKIKDGKLKADIDNINELTNMDDMDDDNLDSEKKSMGLLHDLTKISIMTYPTLLHRNDDNYNNMTKSLSTIGAFSKSAIDADFDNGNGGYYKSIKQIGQRKKTQYKFQSHAIFDQDMPNEAPFCDEKHLYKYSTKFDHILKIIKKSKGLSLVFSQFIEQSTLSFALTLEQNGFVRYSTEGEEPFLLDYPAKKTGGGKRPPICYLCGNHQNHIDHNDEKSNNYHIFKIAKYILFFGSTTNDIVKIKREEALKKFCSENNKYGEEIKVFIGTRTISEGLDFKRLRQVHIIEPWYNLSRHEQIIGRAIRNLSHKDLLSEERNVEIYQYAAIIEDNKNKLANRETIDLKNYRIAENKDVIIKNIGRIMKESAVDCVLFRNTNIIESTKKVKQITSSGEILDISIEDKPFTSICDYKDKCNYTCNWMVNPRINYPINTDTYNIRFAAYDIEKIKKHIKNMFRENLVYHLDLIENNILKIEPSTDKIFIYSALEKLVDNKKETVYDKFSRKGYIIYRGDYYVFQPFDLDRDDIPLIYRMLPSDNKPNYVDLETIQTNYIENTIGNNTKIINEDKLIENIFIEINDLYKLHIKIGSNEKIYLYSIIGMIIDNLDSNNKSLLFKYILINYLKNNKMKYISDIINYLNISNKLINYYSEIQYDKSKIKNNLYVGYIINNQYYIIDVINKGLDITKINHNNIIFEKCIKEILSKIKSYKSMVKQNNNSKKYNIIYGVIEYDYKKDTKKFKIIDKSIEEEVLTKEKQKSKRSIITGRICSTFQVNKLKEMREKIGMYELEGKRGIEFICKDLEIYFRYNKLLNVDNKVWLEEVYV